MKRVAMMALVVGLVMGIGLPAMGQEAAAPSSQAQVSQPPEGGVDWSGVGYGAAAAAADVVYVPAKLAYAILGGITGGAGYAITGGNGQTADTIWRSSMGGDYVLTPSMIKGEEPIHFSGPTETPPATTSVSGGNDAGMTMGGAGRSREMAPSGRPHGLPME